MESRIFLNQVSLYNLPLLHTMNIEQSFFFFSAVVVIVLKVLTSIYNFELYGMVENKTDTQKH